MNSIMDLLSGFETVLSPQNLLYAAIGVTIGTLVGVLPGIGPALTIALLLPVALRLDDPTGTLIMFAGIYAGAMYGGSTTSILLNTPGESASVATSIEGYQMARRGRARSALATAAIGSFVAGTISTVLLAFVAAPMASLAVTFRASDYFALAVLAMVTVTAMVGASLVRGLMSLTFGLFLGLIGIDSLTGQARFTFGVPELLDGVDIVTIIVGLFAIGETLYLASRLKTLPDTVAPLEPPGRASPGSAGRTGRVRGGRGCVAPRSGSRSVRCRPVVPRYPPSCRTPWKNADRSALRNGGTARSRGSPGRRRRTTPRSPASWCRCSPWVSRPPPRPR
ncbi:hypothetical protein GCM10027610_015570 [Dactylosporangium cerinum]